MGKVGKVKPMREAMPWVASVIEGLRREFGAGTVDQAMRQGLAGMPTFYAEEAGRTVGTRATLPDPGRCVSVGVVELAKGSKGA